MAKDLDILVIAPMEDTGLEAVLDEAAEKGVPVILSARTTQGEYVPRFILIRHGKEKDVLSLSERKYRMQRL